MSFQSSDLKEDTGSPFEPNRLPLMKPLKAYLTATGAGTSSECTSMVVPVKFASAGWNIRSVPAISNPVRGMPNVVNPIPVQSNETTAFPSSNFAFLYTGAVYGRFGKP